MTLIFDIETDGLLEETTKIHSLVIYDTEKDKLISCAKNGVEVIETVTDDTDVSSSEISNNSLFASSEFVSCVFVLPGNNLPE